MQLIKTTNMKISTKKLLVLATTGSLVMLSAFKINQKVKEVSEIKKTLLSSFFKDENYDSQNYNVESYPDTNIVFTPKAESNKKSILSKTFYGIPAPYTFAEAVDPINGYFSKEFNETFTQTFGKPILGKTITMASFYVDEDTKKKVFSEFTFYDKNGVQAAFDKLYVKPTEDFEGYSMKKLYDLTAKEYMRDFTKLMVYLMNKKPLFIKISADYLAKAKADKNFKPRNVCPGYMKQLFPKELDAKQFTAFQGEIYESTLGSLIRRQCDGTMPVLLNCLKTVLKDYDPEALKLIKGKF